MSPFRTAALLCLLLLLNGCATLSEDECRSANWELIGFEDGSKGKPSHRVGEHREACAEYGISPSMQKYLAGHRRGLRRYCTPRNGLKLGERGQPDPGVCPSDLRRGFAEGYRKGRNIHRLQQDVKAIQKEKSEVTQAVQEMESEIEQKREMVIAQSTGSVLRRELLGQIEVLQEVIASHYQSLEEISLREASAQLRVQQARREAGLD